MDDITKEALSGDKNNLSPEAKEKRIAINKKIFKFLIIPGVVLCLIAIFVPAEEETKEFDLKDGQGAIYGYAKDIVKQNLKSPSTADFGSVIKANFAINNADSTITIQNYVDAQNSFGAKMRMNYIAKFKYVSGDVKKRTSYILKDIQTD